MYMKIVTLICMACADPESTQPKTKTNKLSLVSSPQNHDSQTSYHLGPPPSPDEIRWIIPSCCQKVQMPILVELRVRTCMGMLFVQKMLPFRSQRMVSK